MQLSDFKNQKGFTIIELMAVIAIAVILPTVVISNFPSMKLQFALSRVSHQMVQELRKAQNMTISAVPYKVNGVVTPVSGYGVYIDTSSLGNKKYILYADAAPFNQQYDVSDYTVETIDFSTSEPGVIIKELHNVSGNVASVYFAPPDPATMITPLDYGQNTLEIVFALESDNTQTRTVYINTSGLVHYK